MNPGDQVILSRHARAVTVAEVEGDAFTYYITPGGSPQRMLIADALTTSAGPVEIALLKVREEAEGD